MRLIDADEMSRYFDILIDRLNAFEERAEGMQEEYRYKILKQIWESVKGLINDTPTAEQWISINDRLPESEDEYLVYFGNGEYKFIDMCVWYPTDKEWVRKGYTCKCVTHWMPLPELPNEE